MVFADRFAHGSFMLHDTIYSAMNYYSYYKNGGFTFLRISKIIRQKTLVIERVSQCYKHAWFSSLVLIVLCKTRARLEISTEK